MHIEDAATGQRLEGVPSQALIARAHKITVAERFFHAPSHWFYVPLEDAPSELACAAKYGDREVRNVVVILYE